MGKRLTRLFHFLDREPQVADFLILGFISVCILVVVAVVVAW